jgi:hypothetical protein
MRIAPILLLALAAAACPPVREDNPGDGSTGNSLQTALFARQQDTGLEYYYGYVWLVDADYTCQRVLQDWGLDWYSLSEETVWVSINYLRGMNLDWETEFQSYWAWQSAGTWDYRNAAYITGQVGTGGYSSGDDDIDEPPPDPIGRDVTGNIGDTVVGIEDAMTIVAYDDEFVDGSITTTLGEWDFHAENCGYLGGGFDGIGDGGGDTGDPVPNEP